LNTHELRAIPIANLLTDLAGWRWVTRGNSIVVSKAGRRNIVLTEPFTLQRAKEIEAVVAHEVTPLLTKQYSTTGVMPKLSREELTTRFTVALALHQAGFKSTYIMETAGLVAYYAKPGQLRPAVIEAMGVEAAVNAFWSPVIPRKPYRQVATTGLTASMARRLRSVQRELEAALRDVK